MGGYIGLIYGTGFNICYYDPEKGMLINTEAGGYSGFEQSLCDAEIDAESESPGDQRCEKMVSGAYFSTVVLKTIRLAAREGLFSAGTAEAIGALTELDAVTIDMFMREGGFMCEDGGRGTELVAFGGRGTELGALCGGRETELGALCAADGDAAVLFEIIDGLYERAAKLVAIAITAVLHRSGAAASRKGYIVAEGSAFRYGFNFRERFERHIMARARGDKPYELVLADDHILIGAAASVFL